MRQCHLWLFGGTLLHHQPISDNAEHWYVLSKKKGPSDCPKVEKSILTALFFCCCCFWWHYLWPVCSKHAETCDWLLRSSGCSNPSRLAVDHHVSSCFCVFFRATPWYRWRLFAAQHHLPSPTLSCVQRTAAKSTQGHLILLPILSPQNTTAPSIFFRCAHTLLFRPLFRDLPRMFCSILCWNEPGDPPCCRWQRETGEPPATLLTSGDYLPSCPFQLQQPGEIWMFGLS